MLTLDQLRALYTVADAERAWLDACHAHPYDWLLRVRLDALSDSVQSAHLCGVSGAQIRAIVDAVRDEFASVSSPPEAAA